MYISQNLRQSWYGNLLGEEENDDDQDAMKVSERMKQFLIRSSTKKKIFRFLIDFSVLWSRLIRTC